jgi:hypothetical protein
MKLHWSFSIWLGLTYLGVFHLWLEVGPVWVRISAVLASFLLGTLFLRAWLNREFVNGWDAIIHASVIFDILLEGLIIRWHEHYGFYLCEVGFAVILVGYRCWWMRMHRPMSDPPIPATPISTSKL